MKRLIYIFIGVILLTSSCSDKLAELNKNPNSPTSISPGPLLTYIQLNTTFQTDRRSSVGFCMMMMQQTATIKTGDLEGDKYLESINEGQLFDFTYNTLTPNISALLAITKDNPAMVNTHAMAEIWKVLVYSRVTDMYGAIPYSEAGNGYSDQIYKPKYDSQESIYKSMLQTLSDAAQTLDASKPTIGDADAVYNGDVSRWKKLAYSLMLRLGMRMSNVAPDLAKQWVNKAIAGGGILNNTDNCYIRHPDEYNVNMANRIAFFFAKFNLLSVGDIKISNTFVQYLKNTDDPRLSVFCSLPNGDNTRSNQQGLPNGYDAQTIQSYPGWTDLKDYSTFNTQYILQYDAPTFLITASENHLLYAEAIARGYIAGSSTDAAMHYNDAIVANMDQVKLYGASVPNTKVTAYLALNPYPVAGTMEDQIKAIGNQYWVCTFLEGYESFSNWRRTGYPELTPVNYPGNASNGTIPRRLTYPQGEYSANGKNIQDAIERQGSDSYTTRVWWDKE